MIDKDQTFMAPILDIINFSHQGNVGWEQNTDRSGMVITAFQDINKDEQLFIEISRKNNLELLAHYGFLFQDNEENSYPIDVEYDEADPLV